MVFTDTNWEDVFVSLGMSDFDDLWNLSLEQVDHPNTQGSGWSSVGYFPFENPVHGLNGIYIKRQQDFGKRQWLPPFKLVPTFRHEYGNLELSINKGLPVVRPLLYRERVKDGHQQVVLITAALEGYTDLSDETFIASLGIALRRKLVRAVAREVRQLHREELLHGCLYPKHIFIKLPEEPDGDIRVRLIDLERLSNFNWWNRGAMRDLDSLHRRSYGWNDRDRMTFLREYCEDDKIKMHQIIRHFS